MTHIESARRLLKALRLFRDFDRGKRFKFKGRLPEPVYLWPYEINARINRSVYALRSGSKRGNEPYISIRRELRDFRAMIARKNNDMRMRIYFVD